LSIGLFFTVVSLLSKSKKPDGLFVINNRWEFFLKDTYRVILLMLFDNLNENKGQSLFPIVLASFFDVLLLNLVGLIPSTFSITGHFIFTFGLSASLFFGMNIIYAKKHEINIISLFLPPNTSLVLALLLVPIEFISYFFKPISLATRLFANIMGGHTLLKVIAGFGFTLLNCSGIVVYLHVLPSIILVPLFGLELGVSIIQAFVFCILLCIYLGDGINLH